MSALRCQFGLKALLGAVALCAAVSLLFCKAVPRHISKLKVIQCESA